MGKGLLLYVSSGHWNVAYLKPMDVWFFLGIPQKHLLNYFLKKKKAFHASI